MGGKTWRVEEEVFFWQVVVPQSPESVDPTQRRYSWKECAEMMQAELGHLRHRMYNKQLLYEHFYQNMRSSRPSPRAKDLVREYLKQRGPGFPGAIHAKRQTEPTTSLESSAVDPSVRQDGAESTFLATGSIRARAVLSGRVPLPTSRSSVAHDQTSVSSGTPSLSSADMSRSSSIGWSARSSSGSATMPSLGSNLSRNERTPTPFEPHE